MTKLRNLFEIPDLGIDNEFSEILAEGDIRIERIVSTGQITPEGQWYDQEVDEWVVLLNGEARLLFEDREEISLTKGDYILIKAHEKHRVIHTSTQPPCIWLAIHGRFSLTS